MQIIRMQYSEDLTQTLAVDMDGKVHHIPYPCHTWHGDSIDKFKTNGGVIEPYAPPQAYWLNGEKHTLHWPDELPEGASFEKPLEVVAQEVRDERDRLLQKSDPLALKYGRLRRLHPTNTDYAAKQADLDNYRNALCDIPQQEGFPNSVVFPEPPVME